jgi:hypothetical protein
MVFMDKLSTRDQLAVFIAAQRRVANPVEIANQLAAFVDGLLADAWDAGWDASAVFNYPGDMPRDEYNPYRQENR